MFEKEVYKARREALKKKISGGIAVFPGNSEAPENYLSNQYRFRQDSSFLYFFGIDEPDFAAVIDFDSGEEMIFGNDVSIDDIIWMGPQPTVASKAERIGVNESRPFADLFKVVGEAVAKGRKVHFLPPYRYYNMLLLSELIGVPCSRNGNDTRKMLAGLSSVELTKAVISLRLIKEACEIEEIDKACDIGYEMHYAAMKNARLGMKEQELVGLMEGITVSKGWGPSFAIILSQNGETLHNHTHHQYLTEGRLFVIDAGAESNTHYASDFTRTLPASGKFTEKQAHQDLQIALWYAFACNNLDDYLYYCQAADWMKDSEASAKGCGTWYYRYAVALMYCGRLEEARDYAERGAAEEPDYPWIWLEVGKLRSHFGDKAGALAAVERGLALVPGDYEFLTLREEINAGATLEQMEYHWINPEADASLQAGLDDDADDKQRAIACIRVDDAGLAAFHEIFRPKPEDYLKNDPYCAFHYPVKGHSVEVAFRMNEAGLSKLGTHWLRQLKDWLDSGDWLTYTPEEGLAGTLAAVFVDQTRRMGLLYLQPDDNRHFQIFREADGSLGSAVWFENPPAEDGTAAKA